MTLRRAVMLGFVCVCVFGCERTAPQSELDDVVRVHGGHGPWAVLGYRMGRFALAHLDLERFSFDVEVTHRSPPEVQYRCVADGAAAATGASVGKLNLVVVDTAEPSQVTTTYRNRKTGKQITLRPTRAFIERFLNVPRERLNAEGKVVMTLPDRDLFEVVVP